MLTTLAHDRAWRAAWMVPATLGLAVTSRQGLVAGGVRLELVGLKESRRYSKVVQVLAVVIAINTGI